jgi:hypothetical protein
MMAARGDGGRPIMGALVTTPISHRTDKQPQIHYYRRTIATKHFGTGNKDSVAPDRTATKIQSFSNKSRSRLRFVAANASIPLISQFALTYHEHWPEDGRIVKKHLDAWLKALKRICPKVGYLWILEFQTRNAPHYHVFLSMLPDPDTWAKLAEAWIRITGGTDDALWWHGPKRGKTWIAWDMGTAQYLAKYLDKESQKAVPEGFESVGRFWGNSRNIKPIPLEESLEELDELSVINEETGEFYGGKSAVIRWLGRYAEMQTHGYSRFRKRAGWSSYRILDGMRAYRQIEGYFSDYQKRQKRTKDPCRLPDCFPF